LKDEVLGHEDLLAKTVMTLQVCTGMMFCDIVSLRCEHVKHNNMTGEWQIKKQ
jgi:hypothetical protein